MPSFCRVKVEEDKAKQIDSVAFFRDKVEPAWEDEVNAKGGDF